MPFSTNMHIMGNYSRANEKTFPDTGMSPRKKKKQLFFTRNSVKVVAYWNAARLASLQKQTKNQACFVQAILIF